MQKVNPPPALPLLTIAVPATPSTASADDDAPASPSSTTSKSSPTNSECSDVPVVSRSPKPAKGFLETPSLLPPVHEYSAHLDSLTSRSIPAQLAHTHPYARLVSKKDGSKRRKIWNHALEKSIFTSQEISSMGAPRRRTIYIASLEAHVDQLHAQLLDLGLYPVPFERLEIYRGLNSKTAKSMVAGLHHDSSHIKMKLLELERANRGLDDLLTQNASVPDSGPIRRHSVDMPVSYSHRK
ncbi:hypothetical protein EWM64_g428 [Hericium alpestre]|uniref:Uncharacterized protein n=1 Tax=Hericium alpestre TaxID=135208 RepID=A0A4Z0A973_9AGAM|nr:hypothetical protein EWM64_g428 [Hericium alpestre]